MDSQKGGENGSSGSAVPFSGSTNGSDFKFEFDGKEGSSDTAVASSCAAKENVPVNYFVIKPTGEDFKFDFDNVDG